MPSASPALDSTRNAVPIPFAVPATARRARRSCSDGLHRITGRHRDAQNPDLERAVCANCGCQLVRTQISRRWCFSGVLG